MADAGWYPDPSDPTAQRYWDGSAWTEHKAPAPGGQPAYQPAYATPAAYGQPAYGYVQPAYGYVQQGPPIRKFGFGEAIKRGLNQWKNYSDRATVAEYWWFFLFEILLMVPLYICLYVGLIVIFASSTTLDSTTGNSALNISGAGIAFLVIFWIVVMALALFLFLPRLALLVRRLHDTDKSGWWVLISFVPFGSLVILVFSLMPSTPGPNQYGPPVT